MLVTASLTYPSSELAQPGLMKTGVEGQNVIGLACLHAWQDAGPLQAAAGTRDPL